jgi:hypothetical protein
LAQDRGGAEFHTGGIHQYFEDLKRGTNKDIGPKDIFEIASKKNPGASWHRGFIYLHIKVCKSTRNHCMISYF